MPALPSLAPHRAGGRIKLLAVNTLKRSAQAPEVPTVAEVTGIRDCDYPPVIGILAPSTTPEEYAAQNRTDFVKYAKVVKAAGLKAE